MGLKALFFLGFFLATFLLISSHVSARDLAEVSNTEGTANDKVDKTNEVGVDQYGGGRGGGGYGGGRGGYGGGRGGGGYGGGRGGGGYGGGYGGGRGCRYGCCGGGYGRCRCCNYAGQVADADWQSEPGN